jgi:hypothetical protein
MNDVIDSDNLEKNIDAESSFILWHADGSSHSLDMGLPAETPPPTDVVDDADSHLNLY